MIFGEKELGILHGFSKDCGLNFEFNDENIICYCSKNDNIFNDESETKVINEEMLKNLDFEDLLKKGLIKSDSIFPYKIPPNDTNQIKYCSMNILSKFSYTYKNKSGKIDINKLYKKDNYSSYLIKDVKFFVGNKMLDYIPLDKSFVIKIRLGNDVILDLGKLKSKKAYVYKRSSDNIFSINMSSINNYIFNNNLILFNLKSDDMAFEGINKKEFENLFFFCDLDGNMAFESEVFKEVYLYNKDYIIAKNFENKICILNINSYFKIKKYLDVDDIVLSLKDREFAFKKYICLKDAQENLTALYEKSKKLYTNNYIIVCRNGLYGVYSLLEDRYIIYPKYLHIYFLDKYIICSLNSKKDIYSDSVKIFTICASLDCIVTYIYKSLSEKIIICDNLSTNISTIYINSNKINTNKIKCLEYVKDNYILVSVAGIYDYIDLKNKCYIINKKNITDYYKNNSIKNLISNTDVSSHKTLYSSYDKKEFLVLNSFFIKKENYEYSVLKINNVKCYYISGKYVILHDNKSNMAVVYDLDLLFSLKDKSDDYLDINLICPIMKLVLKGKEDRV